MSATVVWSNTSKYHRSSSSRFFFSFSLYAYTLYTFVWNKIYWVLSCAVHVHKTPMPSQQSENKHLCMKVSSRRIFIAKIKEVLWNVYWNGNWHLVTFFSTINDCYSVTSHRRIKSSPLWFLITLLYVSCAVINV